MTEDKIDYGEIKSVEPKLRSGGIGHDADGNPFVYTITKGWRPMSPDRYEAKYWKKKYMELAQIKKII
jgi:hypothetical protein